MLTLTDNVRTTTKVKYVVVSAVEQNTICLADLL